MKRLSFLIIAGLALCLPSVAFGQENPAKGIITTNGAATCVTAGSCVRFASLPVNNGSVGIQVGPDTFTGTLSFESTVDGATYTAAIGCVGASGAASSTTTSGKFQCPAGGLTGFQVRGSAAITGAAVVTIQSGAGDSGSTTGAVTVSGTVNVDPVANTIGLATGAKQDTTNSLLTPLIVSGAGGYVRQDSTATIAKESGGNLATLAGTVTAAKVGVSVDAITAAASGPATAANSDSVVQAYNPVISGLTSAMTGTTSTQVIAGTASNYQYITWCIVDQSSITVSTSILLQDGSGGTTIGRLPAPAGTTATTGTAGAIVPFPTPLKVPTSGNGLYAANVTTGSSVILTCGGWRSTISY